MRFVLLCLSLMFSASPSWPQESLGLAAPGDITQSGILKHILPRFSLKTGVRVVADENGIMALSENPPGQPVFEREGVVYHLRIGNDPRQEKFRDWLLSDIGKRTIESFVPNHGEPFSARVTTASAEETQQISGDAALGETLSLNHCGRCHVIGPQNRMNGLGSTPSFAVLRTLPDWSERFQRFYALNPHPAFTQIDGITAPFAPERPSPIHPVHITQDELEAILAFVSVVRAADLGAPLQHQ